MEELSCDAAAEVMLRARCMTDFMLVPCMWK